MDEEEKEMSLRTIRLEGDEILRKKSKDTGWMRGFYM